MPKRLIVLNAVLLALAAGGTVYIVRQLTSPMPMPQAGRSRPAPPAPAPAEVQPPPPGGYSSVAARNLFSPTRTESPPAPTVAASPAVKPNLFGVVLREGAPVAYLEDPNTKRVAGYRVGDSVAGGTVQTINSEGIVINRPDGNMDVRLRDPSKPRPTPVALPPGAAPGASAWYRGIADPGGDSAVGRDPWRRTAGRRTAARTARAARCAARGSGAPHPAPEPFASSPPGPARRCTATVA